MPIEDRCSFFFVFLPLSDLTLFPEVDSREQLAVLPSGDHCAFRSMKKVTLAFTKYNSTIIKQFEWTKLHEE
jgi:hypothetical protein